MKQSYDTLTYDTLTIEINHEMITIRELLLTEALNEHCVLNVTFFCTSQQGKTFLERSDEQDRIRLCEGERTLFTGILSQADVTENREGHF